MGMLHRAAGAIAAGLFMGFGTAQAGSMPPEMVMRSWDKLILELVRHTPTYSPPVAARAFAYVGVAGYEATASGSPDLKTLAGQLNGLTPLPARDAGQTYDEAIVMQATMARSVHIFFFNTGPTGQRAMAAMEQKLGDKVSADVPADVAARSAAYGQAVADHIVAWSQDDGGAVITDMGFPMHYDLTAGPAHWVPTSQIVQQQAPLLPDWGKNRPFAMPTSATCDLPPPPAYSEDTGSEFYRQAREVYDTANSLSDEQRTIARFWSDDPMLSATPPGHWVAIALDLLEAEHADAARSGDVMARVGIATADAFIGCWQTKFEYDLVRPVTYIRRVIDPKWDPLLITPPFPEYPSGHSTQSGAAAAVLSDLFGTDFAFDDAAHVDDGMPARHFASFWAAAEEAALSRLYGGIHFRAAIERGLDQGRCIGAYTNALHTRN